MTIFGPLNVLTIIYVTILIKQFADIWADILIKLALEYNARDH